MTATLAQLIVAQDQPTILAAMYTTAAAMDVDVVGVQSERLFRALYEIEATAKTNEQSLRVAVTKGAFLDLAAEISPYSSVIAGKTTWLDLLAAGYYDLSRSPATKTVGILKVHAIATATGGSIAAGAFKVSDGVGNFYQNVDEFTVLPGNTVPVVIKAMVAGAAGNVPNSTIVKMVTTIGGVTIFNPPQPVTKSWITSAGVDAESNPSLITRCRARWSATSYGGAAGAYGQWITEAFTSVGLVSTITRQIADDTNPNGPGSTDIYIANASGPATGTEVGIVDVFLQPRRGLGRGPLRTLSAPQLTVPLHVTVYGSLDSAVITAAINLVFTITPLGGVIFIDAITAALLAISGVYNAPVSNGVVKYSTGAVINVPVGYVPVAAITLTVSP
jgi:uncharacterized phage protein gp47/JayE